MILRPAMPVPTMEKIKEIAVMRFIAIRLDAMMIVWTMMITTTLTLTYGIVGIQGTIVWWALILSLKETAFPV